MLCLLVLHSVALSSATNKDIRSCTRFKLLHARGMALTRTTWKKIRQKRPVAASPPPRSGVDGYVLRENVTFVNDCFHRIDLRREAAHSIRRSDVMCWLKQQIRRKNAAPQFLSLISTEMTEFLNEEFLICLRSNNILSSFPLRLQTSASRQRSHNFPLVSSLLRD